MRWVFRLIGVLVLLLVLAVGAVFLLPADRIARIAADQIKAATGREVNITGDVSVTLWPVIGASVGGLEVGNADWSKQGPMLTAENAAIGVDAAALLRGAVVITRIEATRPTIRLEQRADGRASWQFTDSSGQAQIEAQVNPSTPAREVSIQRLEVTDATLIYDAEGADLVEYSGVELVLDWPERLGPAQIAARLQAVTMDATIEGFAGFIGGQVQPVDVTLRAGGGLRRSKDGRARLALWLVRCRWSCRTPMNFCALCPCQRRACQAGWDMQWLLRLI